MSTISAFVIYAIIRGRIKILTIEVILQKYMNYREDLQALLFKYLRMNGLSQKTYSKNGMYPSMGLHLIISIAYAKVGWRCLNHDNIIVNKRWLKLEKVTMRMMNWESAHTQETSEITKWLIFSALLVFAMLKNTLNLHFSMANTSELY